MKIAILVFENCSAWGVGGSIEIFSMANRIYGNINKAYSQKEFFEIKLVSAAGKNIKSRSNFLLSCDKTINHKIDADLIIVTGVIGDLGMAIKQNPEMINWLKKQYSKGAAVASYCTGMIFLAAAGLVDYRCASTHWMAEKFIHDNFPKVKLDIKRTIVDEDNIYTCGGSASFQNLVLYLIEKFMGMEYAVLVSKVMLIDINKDIQTSYAILDYHKDHSDESIHKVQNFIEKNINAKLTLEELSDYSAMSQRNFIRRFKKATGENPGIYIQKAKIESAKKLLEKGDSFSIEEIAFKIGYEDIGSFRNTFKKFTGVSPADYKTRFNRRVEQMN